MADPLPDFKYSPLIGKDSIRLLIVQPAQAGSDIHCDLIHTTISECYDEVFDHYTALSYVWGDATNRRIIYVNSTAFGVTSNLFDALEDIRHEQHSLRLWADAVCIDQTNFEERSSQVGLMRQIYCCASFTIIYLGKSNVECDKLMAAIREGRFENHHMHVYIFTTHILSRPWFKRVWIFQELVLSRAPVVQIGQERVRWDALHVAFFGGKGSKQISKLLENSHISLLQSSSEENNNENEGRKAIATFHSMHMARDQSHGPPTLLSVLISRRGFGVTDARDMIFGNLAIADLLHKEIVRRQPCLIVDYQRSAVDVFTGAAIYMLSRRSRLTTYHYYECLLFVDSLKPRMTGLPSWVPDWSSTSGYTEEIPSIKVRIDSTAGSILAQSNMFSPAAIFPEPGTCIVRLLRIGRIQWVNIGSPSDSTYAKDLLQYIQLNREWHDLIKNKLMNPSTLAGPGSLFSEFTTRQHVLLQMLYEVQESKLQSTFSSILFGRRLATVTSSSHLCLVPNKTEVDDVIYAFPHCSELETWSFLVLRPMVNFPGMGKLQRDFKDSDAPGRIIDEERHFTVVGRCLAEDASLQSWSQTPEEKSRTSFNPGHNITLH